MQWTYFGRIFQKRSAQQQVFISQVVTETEFLSRSDCLESIKPGLFHTDNVLMMDVHQLEIMAVRRGGSVR